jgi:oligopeptidase B
MENTYNFKLMTTQEDLLQKENWKDFIQHREDVLLEGFILFNEFLVVSERINGITNIFVQKWNGKSSYINFGEESYMVMTSINPDPDSITLRLEYTSLTTPATSFEYNMETGELKTLKEQEIVGGYNKEEYVSKRLYAEASDGEKIPISIVYNKSFEN